MKHAPRPPRRRAPKVPQTLGQRLWAARERLGLTQRALGQRLGVGQAAISAWEKDVTQPRESAWPLLACALGLSQRTLETGDGFDLSLLPDRAYEVTVSPLGLPGVPDGAEVLVVSAEGLALECQTAREASRRLQNAVRAGRPVWLVLG